MGILKTLAIVAIGFVVVVAIVNGVGAPATPSAPSALPPTSNAAGKADAQARYHSCVSGVETDYDYAWANECRRIFQPTETGPRYTPNCALPVSIANELNAILERHRDRCLQEVNAGLR